MDSVVAKYFNSEGFLTAEIAVLRDQANIEDVFVVLHFDGPPEHFACLHVKKLSVIYYDSLPNNNDRPFNEYPDLRDLGEIEIHVPAEYQEEVECGCMAVLRYWKLFHNAKHNNIRGKAARIQVLKYCNRENNKEVKGTGNCDEEQTQQTRSRTALTRQGPFSRLFRRCLTKRL